MLAIIYAKYALYRLVHTLYNCLQGLLWVVNGTYFQLWRNKGIYESSAQLSDIIYRYKLDLVLEPSGPQNFITTHNGFVSPSYVLQDNVTLYYVTAKQAVFVESDEDLDVSHSDHGAFLRVAQFKCARRIIIVPIAAFHELADKLGDPKGEIIFVTNTSRCGSTLLNQIYEETGLCIGFSEPDALNAIATYTDKMPKVQLDRLIKNSIRIQCKPFRNRRIDAFILKPTAPTIDAVPMFLRIFPNSKQIFMYRDGLKVAQSLVRAATQMPTLALVFILTKIHPRLAEMGVEAMGLPAKDFKVKLPSPICFSVFIWAMICRKYLTLRKDGFKIDAVKYEDLVKHPLESTKAIFEYSNLPLDLVEKATKALSKDSQRNSPLSMKSIGQAKVETLDGNDKVVADAICDQMGLPRIPVTCTLEGTMTTNKLDQHSNGVTK